MSHNDGTRGVCFCSDCTPALPSLAVQNKPDLYMYGMLCAMLATGIWLIVATYFEVRAERLLAVGWLAAAARWAAVSGGLEALQPTAPMAPPAISATLSSPSLLPPRSSPCPPPTPSSVL